MDEAHIAYLERHHEMTQATLAHLHLLLGRQEYEEATSYLAKIRADADELWTARAAHAQRLVAGAQRGRGR